MVDCSRGAAGLEVGRSRSSVAIAAANPAAAAAAVA